MTGTSLIESGGKLKVYFYTQKYCLVLDLFISLLLYADLVNINFFKAFLF